MPNGRRTITCPHFLNVQDSSSPAYILYPDVVDSRLFGGKAGALARLADTDLPVPDWFVVSPEALYIGLTAKQTHGPCRGTRTARMHWPCWKTLHWTTLVQEQLAVAVARLSSAGERLAVRSSALYEDSAGHSFAGQLESFLDVAASDVAARVIDVWRSGFSHSHLCVSSGTCPFRRTGRAGCPGSAYGTGRHGRSCIQR